MTTHYLVAGAGCAGLSLAHRLSNTELDVSMTLVESRSEYGRDRTWCHWPVVDHPYDDCVEHEWTSWSVEFDDRRVSQTSSKIPYQMIAPDQFYDKTRDSIANDDRIQLNTGSKIMSTKLTKNGIRLITDETDWEGDWLVDTRPKSPGNGELIQHFLGWEIKTERECFDPTTVTLMDFWKQHHNGVHFVYVLPTALNRALVEVTWISTGTMDQQEYAEVLECYLNEKLHVQDYEVEYTEYGVIPLEHAFENYHPERTITMGNRGGATRPSTGYTFQGIQRQVSQFIEQLSEDGSPRPVTVWSRRALFLDAVFLRLIKHKPEQAPEAFFDLFTSTESEQLVRFLTDGTRPSDLVSVVGSMPTWPMTKESIRYLFRGL